MLASLRLINFRAFGDFSISFGDGSYLVGPNNAGKSTILTSLRTVDTLLRYAYRRRPSLNAVHDGRHVTAYPVSLTDYPALQDSLRHEFGDNEARLELKWRSGAKIVVVWPEEGEDSPEPFFFLESRPGMLVRDPVNARTTFPSLGVIPILAPVEHSEPLLNDAYVRQNIAGRLSSRHFRNQLRLLQSDGLLELFWLWSRRWLDELRFDRFGQHLEDSGAVLELYFFEATSRVPKEIVWAGDGIQIWLQLMFHIHRVMSLNTIILDEPEVYLHPDLQRRLVQVLESTGKQIILATHSAEIVAEAEARLVVLIDKSKRRARRSPDESSLELMSAALGTAFNLRLARALRSKVVLFVEGQDMTIIRRLARTLRLDRLAAENGITVIPLQGYSRWGQVLPFSWLLKDLLPEAVAIFVILDRDYRSESTIADVEQTFRDEKVVCHVWRRKELESYLLTPEVVARQSGAPLGEIAVWITEITNEMESDVFGRLLGERIKRDVAENRHLVEVTSTFKSHFDEEWKSERYRLETCPPKQIISKMNSRLQAAGFKTISSSSLARAHRADDIAAELVGVLEAVSGESARRGNTGSGE